jgi:hypothetical protein
MIGYGLSLPVRIVELVKDVVLLALGLFTLLHTLVLALRTCRTDRLAQVSEFTFLRFIAIFGSLASIVAACLGTVAPPLAYKLDEKIQSQFLWNSQSFSPWFSVAYDRLAIVQEVEQATQGVDLNQLDRLTYTFISLLDEPLDRQRAIFSQEMIQCGNPLFTDLVRICMLALYSADEIDRNAVVKLIEEQAVIGTLPVAETFKKFRDYPHIKRLILNWCHQLLTHQPLTAPESLHEALTHFITQVRTIAPFTSTSIVPISLTMRQRVLGF